MLSRTAEYAMRAVVALAEYPDAPVKSQDLAEATGTPGPYLANILKSLTRTGLLDSRAGRHGGYMLGRPASKITLLEVVNAVDPLRTIGTCPMGLPEHESELCQLHTRLQAAMTSVERFLGECTVGEIIADSCDGGLQRVDIGS